jgi:hypothetical protein
MEVNVCKPTEIVDRVEDASRLRKQQRRRMMKALRIISLLALLPLSCTGATWACPPQPKHVSVTIHPGSEGAAASLAVHPATVRVKENCTFVIEVPPGMTVKTIAKDQNAKSWLDKSSNVNPITIKAPALANDNDYEVYKYKIEITGFGMLDPYVRVTR